MAKKKTTRKKASKKAAPKPVKEMSHAGVGHIAFLIGIVLAIVATLVANVVTTDATGTETAAIAEATTFALVLLGVIVGLINITTKETMGFLVSAITLILASTVYWGGLPFGLGQALGSVLNNIVAFVSPAAIVVALKTVWKLAKDV